MCGCHGTAWRSSSENSIFHNAMLYWSCVPNFMTIGYKQQQLQVLEYFHKNCCYHGNDDSAHTKNNWRLRFYHNAPSCQIWRWSEKLQPVERSQENLCGAQWARMKPNCAKTVFILNFAADSSGALKCSFFYLLCSPFRLNNEMLTMHRQICLKTAETSPENCKWLQSTRIYAAKFYMTES